MRDFPTGVRYYTFGTVDINFPEDDVCCYRCPLMGVEIKSDREYCRKTGEYLPSPRHITGFNCPIIFNDIKENES
jgi:hypothetical protein